MDEKQRQIAETVKTALAKADAAEDQERSRLSQIASEIDSIGDDARELARRLKKIADKKDASRGALLDLLDALKPIMDELQMSPAWGETSDGMRLAQWRELRSAIDTAHRALEDKAC